MKPVAICSNVNRHVCGTSRAKRLTMTPEPKYLANLQQKLYQNNTKPNLLNGIRKGYRWYIQKLAPSSDHREESGRRRGDKDDEQGRNSKMEERVAIINVATRGGVRVRHGGCLTVIWTEAYGLPFEEFLVTARVVATTARVLDLSEIGTIMTLRPTPVRYSLVPCDRLSTSFLSAQSISYSKVV